MQSSITQSSEGARKGGDPPGSRAASSPGADAPRPPGQRSGGQPLPKGADEGPIEIIDYDAAWPACYTAERDRLGSLLPEVRLHHIGSTAVPGLAAKPVIDMIALVEDLDASTANAMARAGYWLPSRFNAHLRHRRFLCYPSLSLRTHHLHFVDAREDLDRCLRFRDLLRDDPELAGRYEVLKRALAARFQDDREGYTEAKTPFIAQACRRADGRSGSNTRA